MRHNTPLFCFVLIHRSCINQTETLSHHTPSVYLLLSGEASVVDLSLSLSPVPRFSFFLSKGRQRVNMGGFLAYM